MKSFEKKYLDTIVFPPNLISQLTALAEYKGKEELYKKQSPQSLKALIDMAIVESAESSNRIENIDVAFERVKALIINNAMPKNRPEEEVIGYRDVLKRIHQTHQDIPVSNNIVLQFHSMLFRYTTIPSGHWKKKNNVIREFFINGSQRVRFKPISYQDIPQYMDGLINLFNESVDSSKLDQLILIPLFILDFLCIHPFWDGNGRIARLLTLLLLYKAGYQVGRYISLERINENTKDSYYETLLGSSENWHEGQHDPFPWISYFYGVLLAAYKEFESRVGVFSKKGSKTEQVQAAIQEFFVPFQLSDVKRICPNASIDLIRKVMKELQKEGKIKCKSKGRYSKWISIR